MVPAPICPGFKLYRARIYMGNQPPPQIRYLDKSRINEHRWNRRDLKKNMGKVEGSEEAEENG
jgi:hypothetical protein